MAQPNPDANNEPTERRDLDPLADPMAFRELMWNGAQNQADQMAAARQEAEVIRDPLDTPCCILEDGRIYLHSGRIVQPHNYHLQEQIQVSDEETDHQEQAEDSTDENIEDNESDTSEVEIILNISPTERYLLEAYEQFITDAETPANLQEAANNGTDQEISTGPPVNLELLGAVGGNPPPLHEDTAADPGDSGEPDGNNLQPPLQGVPRVIRDRADLSFTKRLMLAIFMNGHADELEPTIKRAQKLIDVLFLVGGRANKPVTTRFCVNLATSEARAKSAARACFLLPRDEDYNNIQKWLNTILPVIRGSITGITNPAGIALTNEEIARFAATHAREFYDLRQQNEETELDEIVMKYLTKVYPLVYLEDETNRVVPLFKLMYLGEQHIPEEYREHMKLRDAPAVYTANHGWEIKPTNVVPCMAEYRLHNHDQYVNRIKLNLSMAFGITGQPLNQIKTHFKEKIFLNYLGRDPKYDDIADKDRELPTISIKNAPWGEGDVIAAARKEYGEYWEEDLVRLYGIKPSEELFLPAPDLYKNSNRTYNAFHNGSRFTIREFDPASRICDVNMEATCRLTPRRLCVQPQDQRLPQMDGISINRAGNFTVTQYKEIPWPNWPSQIRRLGQYFPRVEPTATRNTPIRVLPAGHTPWDILMAFGDTVPFNFNKLTLHTNEIVYRPGQQVSNPYRPRGFQFMNPGDSFIATGPLNAIPQTNVLPGQHMSLKRCGMCNWVYGRVIQCLPCSHTFCGVCLGLTSLITVDRLVCIYCWRVPEKARGKNNNTTPTVTTKKHLNTRSELDPLPRRDENPHRGSGGRPGCQPHRTLRHEVQGKIKNPP